MYTSVNNINVHTAVLGTVHKYEKYVRWNVQYTTTTNTTTTMNNDDVLLI